MLDIAREVDMQTPPQEELVNINEAMRRFNLLYHTIRYAINTGRIPSWRQGNRILIRVVDAQMLAQSHRIVPNEPPGSN